MVLVSLGGCRPTGEHLILRPRLPVSRCFPEHIWRAKPRAGGLGRRVTVGLFAGRGGEGRAPDLDLQAAAARAASIRFRESHRPDPLLIDLYAGCLISNGVAVEDGMKDQYLLSVASSAPCHYTLATKFIDDKLVSLVSGADEVKQMALIHDPTGLRGLPEA